MKHPVALFRKWDIAIIAAVAVISLLPLVPALRRGTAASVTVTQAGEVLYSGPLSKDAVIVTPDGGNTVIIRGGTVTMEDASCPDGLCLHGKATVSHPLVCLPNRVSVTVTGGKEVAPDAVSY